MNRWLLGLVAGMALVFTSCGQQPVSEVTLQERLLPHLNPTNYEFDATIKDVKAAIKRACGDEWRKELAAKNRTTVWKGGGDSHSQRLLTRAMQEPVPRLFWKGDADALTKNILTKPGNEDDAYLYDADAAFESQVYFKDGQPLFFEADFHIHLIEVSPQRTRVEISTYNPTVSVAVDERWSPHGPGLIRVAVEPTTVEEYQILLRIGDKLGTKDMPSIATPEPNSSVKQLTKPRQS